MPLNNPSEVIVSPADNNATSITRATIAPPANLNNAVQLVAANPNRKGVTLWNESTGNILIELEIAPTPASFTAKLKPGGYYELPFNPDVAIHGLWDAPGGTGVFVREFL